MKNSVRRGPPQEPGESEQRSNSHLIVLLFAAVIFLGCIVSRPSLMDDFDAVQAQIARNMLESGDWVTPRLNGIAHFEKAPLFNWLIAGSYRIFGVHDWAARIPLALSAIALCWLTARFGTWASGRRVGFNAGLCLATCVGLFLFTRALFPDVTLTLTVTAALWAFLRALEADEPNPRRWAFLMAASLGAGVLLKGLVAVVLPVGAGLLYLLWTRQLFSARAWQRLYPISGLLILLLIAAPWHVLATLRNPPYFDFTLHAGPGQYRGFFWFYFINEHVLRFLNLRYPRDYATVPRLAFWSLNLVWLFPWSVFFPGALRVDYRPINRAGRARLLTLCWTGFLLLFFTFSTTQEYYSMPIYPALAMLLGCALAKENEWLRAGTRTLGVISALAAVAIAAILYCVHGLPTPGDISHALQQHPEAYTLSLGHMGDLTIQSFAYLRAPLVLAGCAFLVGAFGAWFSSKRRALLAFATMMVLFFHASRMALVVFDPYMSSRPLAEALLKSPYGKLIINGAYYGYSSVFFYTNRSALLLNGRENNLEYGSYAPGSPNVFINDAQFRELWSGAERSYILSDGDKVSHLFSILDRRYFYQVAESGGKFLFCNQAYAAESQVR